MTFSDFLTMQTQLCDALAPHTRILLATMDDAFFVDHYPWWTPLFERFDISDGGGGGACGCADEGPMQALSCSLFNCSCGGAA